LIEDLSPRSRIWRSRIRAVIEAIENMIAGSGLQKRGNSSYLTVLPRIREGRIADLIGKRMTNPPVNKPKSAQSSAAASFKKILDMWAEFGTLLNSYTSCYVRSCYIPYLKVYEKFRKTVETIKRRQGKVFIEDINWKLSGYLDRNIVPDIYFRLGDKIFHFLIDEFQDTSPVQWRNLAPLIENSLSQGGSVFVVGDTKQAIYGFRNADYTIMKTFETENPFPSARHAVQELTVNYRSLQKILEFNEKVFKGTVADKEDYRHAGGQSGLTDYTQKPEAGLKEYGYAEVLILEKYDEEPPERLKIQDLVFELRKRGYRNKDIAILTQKNEDAVRVTAWLNEKEIPFISFSSLDIRRRRITGEIVSLLYFLDSPTDDHALATFILGDIFSRTLARHTPAIDRRGMREFIFAHRDDSPLYKCFQNEFGPLWEKCFSGLFKAAGYLPLYDLVSEIFSAFRVFEILADEEATLVKILEVVKDFEGEGYNSLRDFLEFADDGRTGDTAWNISVPKGIDAVQVMTTHKAKGLGFPVVITLLYEERSKGFDYIAQEDGDGVRLLKITRDTAGCHVDFEVCTPESLKGE
jgi:ATP-dependent exoDNAse (exonuclease V) beta subunit